MKFKRKKVVPFGRHQNKSRNEQPDVDEREKKAKEKYSEEEAAVSAEANAMKQE